ncbi:MAG: hypothetical protein Q9208_006580 [Pyrenodesmia sp. 3 TL-2023]
MSRSEASTAGSQAKTNFLSLPLEIRDQIYKEVLTVKHDIYHDERYFPPSAISLLRTCKQVRDEGCAVLYGGNTIWVDSPRYFLEWLGKIGASNLKLLSRIRIETNYWKIWELDREPWCQILRFLVHLATGLRHVFIFWNSGGKDIKFVRELGEIKNLRSVTIDGEYALHWPRYLSEKMGVEVLQAARTEAWWDVLDKYEEGTEDLHP